jgi:hypothetical protein
MTFVNHLLTELRQSRLLPVVAVLLVALVAVPLLLSSSGSSSPRSAQASMPAVASPSIALPALSVQSGESHTRLGGRPRDPFAQQGGSNPSLSVSSVPGAGALNAALSGGTSTAAGLAGAGKSTAGTGGGSAGSTGKGSSGVGSSVTGAVGGAPAASSPSAPAAPHPHKPAPTGLNPNQVYNVDVAMTDPSGGLNTIDSVERLSILPSKRQQLLVELGVLKGGRQVLFAVQPGAEVSGPGKCTPGPVDCEILSLSENQIESVGADTGSGVTPVADFAVTAITAKRYGSRDAASAARRKASAAGRRLLNGAGLDSLSLFPYRPNIGAIVDLRNLKVGGG